MAMGASDVDEPDEGRPAGTTCAAALPAIGIGRAAECCTAPAAVCGLAKGGGDAAGVRPDMVTGDACGCPPDAAAIALRLRLSLNLDGLGDRCGVGFAPAPAAADEDEEDEASPDCTRGVRSRFGDRVGVLSRLGVLSRAGERAGVAAATVGVAAEEAAAAAREAGGICM